MAKKQKSNFVSIPDEWAHKDLDITSRFILGVIHRFMESGKDYRMKRETFCELYKMDFSLFRRRFQFLLDQGLVVKSKALAKGIKVYVIDYNELEFFLINGKSETKKVHNEPSKEEDHLAHNDNHLAHNDKDLDHNEPSLLPNNNQIKTKKNTKPENSIDDISFVDELDLTPSNYKRPEIDTPKKQISQDELTQFLNQLDI